MHKTALVMCLLVATVACDSGSATAPATPPPTTTLAPAPTPDPALATCNPLPKKEWLAGFSVKVQQGLGTSKRKVLNANPLVRNADYCWSVGLIPGGSGGDVCETRPEGDAQREACDFYVTGVAKDTGRPGPTWYWNGRFCDTPDSRCEIIAENQFLVFAYGTEGRWEACGGTGSNGACGVCLLDSGTGFCRRD